MDSSSTSPCTNGCGFYGNTATEGYCSLCWKSKTLSTMTTEQIHSELQQLASRAKEVEGLIEQDKQHIQHLTQQLQMDHKRCATCQKKLGVCEGIECRCQSVFCSIHRYPEKHQCTFDYSHLDTKIISRSVGHGQFQKLDRI